MLLNKFIVPPYKSVDAIILSPELHKFWITKADAAYPELTHNDATPPSRGAILSSSTFVVGFMILV